VERDEVGPELEGQRQLLVDDLVEQAAPDREVRVAQPAGRDGQRGRDPVRPAEVAPVG
jgi:hypothetical protein